MTGSSGLRVKMRSASPCPKKSSAVRANGIFKVLRETPLIFRNPMKDSEKVLRETPLIFRFSLKDSEKTYIRKIKRGLPPGASIAFRNLKLSPKLSEFFP